MWWIIGSIIYVFLNLGILAYFHIEDGIDQEDWQLFLWGPFFLLLFLIIAGSFLVISAMSEHVYRFIIQKFERKQGVRLYKEVDDFLKKESPQPNNTTVRWTTFK